MNDLVSIATPGAVSIPESEPDPSGALALALGVMSSDCDHALLVRFVTDAVREEADHILAWMAPRTAPAPTEWIYAWLGRLNLALTFVLPEGDLKLRAPSVVAALDVLPRAAFTPDSLRQAKLHFRGFPGAKDAYDFLLSAVAGLLDRQRALQRVVDFKMPTVASEKPVTQAERNAIVTKFQEAMRGTRGHERSVADQMAALGVNSASRPAYLTPDQIRAARAGAKVGDVVSIEGG